MSHSLKHVKKLPKTPYFKICPIHYLSTTDPADMGSADNDIVELFDLLNPVNFLDITSICSEC